MIMSVSILVTVVFFTRVCLAKRREKERRLKDLECEVPPGYEFHLTDIALYNARALGADQNNSSSPVTYIPVTPNTASSSTAGIQPPPPAARAGGNSTVLANPPSYESLQADCSFTDASAIKGLDTKSKVLKAIAFWPKGCWRRWRVEAETLADEEEEEEEEQDMTEILIKARVAHYLLKFKTLW
ncbi:hypothetical protein BGZ47_007095 [Haplosporangium gracile]|nr:hypothetical protein BGZ47_007095 [Haplosporangium gracile]